MTHPAFRLTAPVDIAPWRLETGSSRYWFAVEAAAIEVTGSLVAETLTQALARFGYQRANGAICRNGREVRRGSAPSNWLWLARLKRRLEARGVVVR